MILRTEGLTKEFSLGLRRKRIYAVQDLELQVQQGEIFGFVGPNGAGKTTTIKMLMGLIFPTRGRAFIFDKPIPTNESKRRIGYLPENPAFPEFLTGRELLTYMGRLADVAGADLKSRCDSLLERVGLGTSGDIAIRKYSKGMVQRLGIAQALVGDPSFLVLDEPMSGLDPIGRKEMRDLILELKAAGKTIFFSTHILPDVETLCERVGVILFGRLRDVGRLGDLLSARVHSVEATVVLPTPNRELLGPGRIIAEEGERLTVVYDSEGPADTAVRAVLAAGGRLLSLTPHRENLEGFFMRRLEEGRARASESEKHGRPLSA